MRKLSVEIIIDFDIVLDVLSVPACMGVSVKVISWERFSPNAALGMEEFSLNPILQQWKRVLMEAWK